MHGWCSYFWSFIQSQTDALWTSRRDKKKLCVCVCWFFFFLFGSFCCWRMKLCKIDKNTIHNVHRERESCHVVENKTLLHTSVGLFLWFVSVAVSFLWFVSIFSLALYLCLSVGSDAIFTVVFCWKIINSFSRSLALYTHCRFAMCIEMLVLLVLLLLLLVLLIQLLSLYRIYYNWIYTIDLIHVNEFE